MKEYFRKKSVREILEPILIENGIDWYKYLQNSNDVLDYLQIGFTAQDKQIKLLSYQKYYNQTYVKEIMPINILLVFRFIKITN